MSSYQALARFYDQLTDDVGYERRADYLERLFKDCPIGVHTVLDLACGTGTLTCLLADRGYEMIGVDGSEEMLSQAQQKAWAVEGERPLFLHQSMPELDLYGTVDAAVCMLDSINYLTSPKDVRIVRRGRARPGRFRRRHRLSSGRSAVVRGRGTTAAGR